MTFEKALNDDDPAGELPMEIPERNIMSDNKPKLRNELLLNNLISDANDLN